MRHLFLMIALLASALPALASEGHDHGPAPKAGAGGPATPRFAAASDLFEMVGVLAGPQRLVVYLDRFADNAPVTDAKVELDIAGAKVIATPQASGDYEAMLPAPLPPGHVAITATVTAGNDTDLLAGEIDIPTDDAGHGTVPARNYPRMALWAAGFGLGLSALIAIFRSLRGRRAGARFAEGGVA